jgi:hypothetical protein
MTNQRTLSNRKPSLTGTYHSRLFTLSSTQTFLLLLTILAATSLQSGVGHAQAIYGSINGKVLDSSGAIVAAATVTVTNKNKGTSKTQQTGPAGTYDFQDLIPDPYSIMVEAHGFATETSETINLSADSGVRFDFQLKVGASTQTIEVSAQAPTLTTDRADVATTLNSLTVEQTPNLIRNVTSLVLLAPGTTASTFSNANAEDPQRSIPIAANGQSPFSSGFILDGANDKDGFIGEAVVNPPLDSIQEVKFINQNYDAEFGAAIAGVTVMQTKSGTNSYHGSAYLFRRSDAQQARDPFTQYPGNNPIGPNVPHTLSNIFGGTFGGPILKQKLFIFADYQGTRQKLGNSFFETVPTALVHSTCTGTTGLCNLSEYLQGGQNQVYDPAQGVLNSDGANTGVGRAVFSGNLIPNSRLAQPSINLLNIIPAPSKPGITNNFVASGFGIYNFNQYDTRVDAQIKPNLHIFGRYGYLGSNQSSPASLGEAGGSGFGAGGWAGSETGGNHSVAVGADLSVSPKVFTDFRFSYFRYAFVEAKYDGTTPLQNNLGMPGLNTSAPGSGGAAQFQIDGLSDLGSGNHGANHCNCPLNMTEQEYGFVNNWTRSEGRHTIKLGGELRFLHELRIPSDTNRSGELAFSQGRTALGTVGGGTAAGLGLASLLFGDVSTMQRYFSLSTTAAETQPRMFLYAQDNWRFSDKLTFNIGGRWEVYFPEYVNGKGQGGFYDSTTDLISVAGYGSIGDNLNIKNNWAFLDPRLGFAYQITAKSVIRAGLGRAFDPGFYGDVFGATFSQTIPVLQNQSESQQDGFATDAARNLDGTVYHLATGPSAPISQFNIPASGQFLLPRGQAPNSRPDKERLPDVFGWNVTYQQELDRATSFTVAYVGNKATHTLAGSTWGGLNWNDPPISGYAQNIPCQGAPFYLRFGSIPYNIQNNNQCGQGYMTLYDHEANAHYNSFQLSVTRRLSKGLQLNASYVLSNATGVGTQGYFIQDPHANWGHFDFNRENDFKLFGIYSLPLGNGQAFLNNSGLLVNGIVSGLSLAGNLHLASGLPYTPSYNECRADAPHYDMPCRPNQVSSFAQGSGPLNIITHNVTYFTPVAALTSNGQTNGAFQRPQPFTFGTMQYNAFFGPGLFTTDLTLKKIIPIHESINLSLEVQAQNVFNHANLSNPSSCIDCTISSGAGLITDILGGTFAGMRQLQFAAHLTF